MIVTMGIDTDPVFLHFLRVATQQGAVVCPINLRALIARGFWSLSLGGTQVSFVEIDGQITELKKCMPIYARLIDLSSGVNDSRLRARWDSLMDGLSSWMENHPARVINRPSAGLHNSSKPLHEYLISKCGFAVPGSLTTACRDQLVAFCEGRRTVVKATSGVRCNTREVFAHEFYHYQPRRGPVHLQSLVEGEDIRAHIVNNECFAERIVSNAVDYRTAKRWRFFRHDLPEELRCQLSAATRSFGLDFCGWDLKLDTHGKYWCLEANPMPGYAPYDRRAGGEITSSIIRSLMGIA